MNGKWLDEKEQFKLKIVDKNNFAYSQMKVNFMRLGRKDDTAFKESVAAAVFTNINNFWWKTDNLFNTGRRQLSQRHLHAEERWVEENDKDALRSSRNTGLY